MQMVQMLLTFTRALREGDWYLYLHAFQYMLPYFMRYDHYNYVQWGNIYLAEMQQLPPAILTEFEQGNFVVKRSNLKFNQVDPDQSQEWLNAVGKKGGGIIGITRTPSALARWALSYNLRSQIASDTRAMYKMCLDDKLVHNEITKSRQMHDNEVEDALVSVLQRFGVFAPVESTALQNIATKDLATDSIQDALLNAQQLGQQQLETFVEERLLTQDRKAKSLHDPIRRNNAATFATLYEVKFLTKEKEKEVILKADRSVLQRLITAYEAGRPVDLPKVLQHELMPVPVSLAETNRHLRTGNKAVLAGALLEGINCPASIKFEGTSRLLIDAQAQVKKIGKPAEAKTFGDLGSIFLTSVMNLGSSYDGIHLVFDRYREVSVKEATRAKRGRGIHAVRRVIEDPNVPLPTNWSNFMALASNKADLARFLSEMVIEKAPGHKVFVVAGGFAEEKEVQCSDPIADTTPLEALHEEADTRLILSAINTNAENITVAARDTDVLLLLVAHLHRMSYQNLWMMKGTSFKRKYIPVKEVCEKLPADSIEALLPFHAMTGCDTTSYISGHGKKSALKVLLKEPKITQRARYWGANC